MQGPKWPLFYSHVDPVWSLLIIGTGCIWVELPVQSWNEKKNVLGSWATAHLPALGHDTMELYRETAGIDG